MFQRKELERLRLQKEQLVSQSNINREWLVSDWKRLQSSELWLGEVLGFARRHPLWVMSLAAATGTLAAKTLRRPRTYMKRISQVGKLVSVVISAWKLFRRKRQS